MLCEGPRESQQVASSIGKIASFLSLLDILLIKSFSTTYINNLRQYKMKRTTFEDSEKEEKTIERPRLEWQQSTAVSSDRASLMPALASSFRNILEDLGEDSSRPGLVDTPDRAAKALLFFTKGYEDRLVDLKTYYVST